MKLLVLNENYPHLGNLMGNVFVHVRVKEYAKKHEVRVFSFFAPSNVLNYEGIRIDFFEDVKSLKSAIDAFQPDRIIVHFYHSWMLDSLIKEFNVPFFIWVHGYEALGWYRRIFNYTIYSPVFFTFIRKNIIQQYYFRKLISYANNNKRVRFVFVSEWMKKVAEIDTLSKVENASIIPNPIDDELFAYQDKNLEMRKRILILRSFNTKKYANDISIEAINILSKKPIFQDLKFTIIGNGQLYKKLTDSVKDYPNVELLEMAVRQVEIPKVHKDYGVFLCPTRQDAQGVSMCEAMSSGLVPVTSRNTAIPEFVENSKTGFLTNNAIELANSIEKLYYDSDLFSSMSRQASEGIRIQCGIKNVVNMELSLIETNFDL